MKLLKRILIIPLLVVAGTWILVQFMGQNPPAGLGIQKEGGLADCPDTPNCVCSGCEGSHQMKPLQFTGEPAAAKSALKNALAAKGIRIIEEQENYLHAVATTPIMRFHDDLEFLIDGDSKMIHFRSASRLGKSDLGKNRARLNELFALLQKDGIAQRR